MKKLLWSIFFTSGEMHPMKKTVQLAYAATFAALMAIPALQAEDGICHRCEVIRENNKSHQNFEYYDDYLKSQNCGQQPASCAPAAKNVEAPKPVTPPKKEVPAPQKSPATAQPAPASKAPAGDANKVPANQANKAPATQAPASPAPVKSNGAGNGAPQGNVPPSAKSN